MLLRERDWSASDLSGLYFDRWPNQEANFRAVNQAVGAKDVHGYGKQLVDNVSVITEPDDLPKELCRLQKTAHTLKSGLVTAEREYKDDQKLLRRREGRLETV